MCSSPEESIHEDFASFPGKRRPDTSEQDRRVKPPSLTIRDARVHGVLRARAERHGNLPVHTPGCWSISPSARLLSITTFTLLIRTEPPARAFADRCG